MELEKQVCSLELAKKLKELGAKQDSFWYYLPKVTKSFMGFILKTDNGEYEIAHPEIKPVNKALEVCYSAFTVAELGEMLKEYKKVTIVSGFKRNEALAEDIGDFFCSELCFGNAFESIAKHRAEKEADVRAKLLIHLIEEGLYGKQDTKVFA